MPPTPAQSATTPPPIPGKTAAEDIKKTTAASGIDFAADAGDGFANVSSKDLQIPFLAIVQDASPMTKRNSAKFVEGANEGNVINTVTQKLYDVGLNGKDSLFVIPVHYQRVWIEWNGRKLVKYHATDELMQDTRKNDKGENVLPNKNVLTETAMHSVYVVDGQSLYPALVSMSKTMLKTSKRWNTVMQGIKMRDQAGNEYMPPCYSHVYKLSTVPDGNDHGNWAAWKVELVGQITDAGQYGKAKKFCLEAHQNPVLALPSNHPDAEADADAF